MVQSGKATLECDEECECAKTNKKNVMSKEERLRQEEEQRLQQVSIVVMDCCFCK